MNYQQINLDEYSLSGAGGTALTYTHKQEKRLAKLFTPGFAADMAAQEFFTSQTVYELGIPTPRPLPPPLRFPTRLGQRGSAPRAPAPGQRKVQKTPKTCNSLTKSVNLF